MPAAIDTNSPASGAPLFNAQLKQHLADFQVEEVLGIDLEGSGEHLYLHIRKAGMNTDEIVSLLESAYSVRSQDIGLAGMKDRYAVTSQWFSVMTPQGDEIIQSVLEKTGEPDKHAKVLASTRHSRKLRRGAHTGNGFLITLRNIMPISGGSDTPFEEAVADRVGMLAVHGFPNYIGPQRFGNGGQNLVRARQWFRQPRKRTSRQQRSLWLSAGRSALFNAVCSARVANGSWQQLMPGEPAILNGSRSFFDSSESAEEELSRRLTEFDIHPSAPWWGRGAPVAKGDCAEFEHSILTNFADICAGLEHAGLTQERRAIRASATDLTHRWLHPDTLELSFHLSPGVFATTLLREFGLCQEPEQRQRQTGI